MMEWSGWNLHALDIWEAAFRISFAAVLGFVVGIDREFKHKPVGLRAYMLVSIGAACFALISLELSFVARGGDTLATPDISRVVQGLTGALGFIGAGAIIQARDKVVGTATAAAIWCVGAVGLAVGFGFYGLAVLVAVGAFFVLSVVGFLRARLRDDVDGKFLVEETEATDSSVGEQKN